MAASVLLATAYSALASAVNGQSSIGTLFLMTDAAKNEGAVCLDGERRPIIRFCEWNAFRVCPYF